MNRSPMGALCSFLALVLVAAALPIPLQAQEKAASVEELAKKSDLIAVGKVRERRASWDAKRTRIETTITMEVDEVLKGSAGRTIEIVTPGGEVGGVGEAYSHTPSFSRDEELVVFVVKDRENRFRVAGGTSGKRSIATDAASGEKLVGGKKRLADFSAEVKNAGRGN